LTSAYLLLIGSELMNLQRDDLNGRFILKRLEERNIKIKGYQIVPDDEDAISEAFSFATASSDIVISSGGLGPTGDDVTREGLAKAQSVSLEKNPKWFSEIRKKIEKRGREIRDFDVKMAMVPKGSKVVPNKFGLAAGIFSKTKKKLIFALPGVPTEFEEMAVNFVLREIDKRFTEEQPHSIKAVLAGIRESEVQEFLSQYDKQEWVSYSILPHYGVLELSFLIYQKLFLKTINNDILEGLKNRFATNLISLDGRSIVEVLAGELKKKDLSLSIAESITGGTLSKKIVALGGASSFYKGGITAYSNEAKTDILGVPRELIEKHGAVSEEVALAMARGARARFLSSCAIATTGIAGPTGETEEKPVGLVHIAVSAPDKEEVHRHVFPFDRTGVIEMASNFALFHLLSLLRK
jgi:nicotinamide-nucleotide amidase